jgi:heme exporter protein A
MTGGFVNGNVNDDVGKAELRIEGLSCLRGGRRVLSDVNFSLSAGQSLFLRGPNGSGKSSLIRTLAGLLESEQGHIFWQGVDVDDDPSLLLHEIFYVGHLDGIKLPMTVSENLRFWSDFLGATPDSKTIDAAIDAFNLGDVADIPGQILSAGQKKRLSLARLLVAPRRLWLLDEPSVSLDSLSTQILADVVRAHCAAGGMMITATHLDMGMGESRQLFLHQTNTPPTTSNSAQTTTMEEGI